MGCRSTGTACIAAMLMIVMTAAAIIFRSYTYKATNRSHTHALRKLTSVLEDETWERQAAVKKLVPEDNSYVAMCLWAKDEHTAIREWILYHHMIGVGKFYLYDDYSYPPLAVAINDLITIGLVEYRFLLPEDKLEEPGHLKHDSVLNTCMAQYGNRHVFMGLIDTDEFIVLRNESSLPHLLEDYERYGGLVLYFRIFGSSGLIGRPSSGILASYTKCQPKDDNSYVKTIARTDACKKITGVHRCSYYQGKVAVNVWKEAYNGKIAVDRSREERAVLHHYVTRSMQDWQWRSRPNRVRRRPVRKIRDYDRNCTEECTAGVQLSAQLHGAFGPLLSPPDASLPRDYF